MPTAKFQVGRKYTHEQTCQLGGNPQRYLPYVDDCVVAGRFDPKLNPDAPGAVFASGDTAFMDGVRLWHQDDRRIPVFLKRGTDAWEYRGVFELARISVARSELRAAAKRSGRTGIDLILNFEPVGARGSVRRDSNGVGEVEGERHLAQHFRYERSTKNRRAAIAASGWSCVVCGFDFEEFYGDRGSGWIEVHHNVPLSSHSRPRRLDPAKDLKPVCANCHRMLHRGAVMSIDELKKEIKAARR